MRNEIKPKVTLVGAGPGDPELITLKGILAINKADVVLYDALIDPALLKHAPDKAIKIYVGKRVGKHSCPQEDTNRFCVEYALKYGHVVRLKGGDPFVFGRGSEEIDYIEAFGIPTEVVSGISSSVAVPASVGIPVTKRGVSESFWVITGTTSSGEISRDIALAAQSTATVVVLMGTKKLAEIVQIYKQNFKADLPIAIIQSGTTKDLKLVAGTISDIQEKAVSEGIGAPAIIIIGEVVKESYRLKEIYGEVVNVEVNRI
ncbi:uroporphyrinogen-III C-methyltransferase [Belliella kenyensis]|uniref:uroporphyrinogen-III C-methyltransferase n=1 Tax=Belliella kenyensis TaxID=1472724 RepID=A0ABV8EPI1_9BACT|nr:uroporphyrinogen-III C-methyltransferase [Belliella kenyensis]MCH7402516.1 uroporphyrinogen-III C-methyltransferase [Belliella kenyensis]MDN3603315.1 uroporphyrinogen-III C-methyltransferase [Belliella kenyensis]